MPLPKLHLPPMNNLRRLSAEIPLILGSGSPRRKDLLQRARIPFTIVTVDVPEDILSGEAPDVAAKRLAALKARHVNELIVRKKPAEPAVVISADTIVWSQGDCLGKPESLAVARELLKSLRGETHQVFTAVSMLMRLSAPLTFAETAVANTAVTFKHVSDDEIERYLLTGDPMDKAGAYGAQELGAFLVDHIEGELDTVIGFPLSVVDNLASILLSKIPRN
jgi:nucleoside triphosphate pyrophosphatase